MDQFGLVKMAGKSTAAAPGQGNSCSETKLALEEPVIGYEDDIALDGGDPVGEKAIRDMGKTASPLEKPRTPT